MGRKRKPDGRELLRLDVFQHLFAAVCEEMGATLQRSAFSPNIRERRDFSCALFDDRGRMIGQASHLPVHLGSTPLSVQAAIASVEMQPGDVVALNDPYAGGTHLPDLTLVSPVYLPGSRKPDFYCANRAHHADVGGIAPGSMAPAPDVHGEGLRVPPVRLVRAGEMNPDVLALFQANMRVPWERHGDLAAQWSTNKVGERRLLEMAAEHGAAEMRARGEGLMDWTERLARELVRNLPSGEWSFEDLLEDNDHGDLAIRVRIRRAGARLIFDFTETDVCPESPLNTTRAVCVSAVFYVLRTLLPAFTPTNDGVLRPVEILTRPGTLVHATYPSGVAAGNVETSQRIVDVIFGCLAQVLPERVPAASAGTMTNLTFGGTRSDGTGFVYYETIAGGAGAGPVSGGAHAVQTHMTNTRNTPIEELERTYPVRILSLGLHRGSGGRGRRRGGEGIRKELLFLEGAHVALVSDRTRRGPWGLLGAQPGRPGRARLSLGPGGRSAPAGGKFSGRLPAGSVLEIRTPGGGGHGS